MNGPYVRRMIPEPGDTDREVPIAETFHEQTNDKLTEKEVKQIEADDQAIEIILMGLPEDIYVAVEVNVLRAERLARAHDPLALMANSNNPYNYPVVYQDQPSPVTYNNFNPQPSFNTTYMRQPMPNPEDITDLTTAMNMALVLMAKAFKLNYSTPTNNKQNGNVVATRAEGNKIRNNGDLKEIEEVNANFILMANLQQTSTSDNIAKTRRPQPRSNTKNDRVPSASKSSCIKNKEVEVEEHHMNLLLSNNKKHMSSKCNNVKLVIRNDKSEVICAMCKQCLINSNHDVCMLNYVNGMNSRNANQSENVSNVTNKKKHKPKVRKSKKLGSKERLASPMPSKPRSCLRWSPTERIFDLNRI
nr:hypothetical protein [Tanacetum cinerariifolium]